MKVWLPETYDTLNKNWSSDNPEETTRLINDFTQKLFKERFPHYKIPIIPATGVITQAYNKGLISNEEKENLIRKVKGLPVKPRHSIQKLWCEETDEIIKNLWGKEHPTKIAKVINNYIVVSNNKNREEQRNIILTGELGNGVVFRAYKLKLITSIEAKTILKDLQKEYIRKRYIPKTIKQQVLNRDSVCQICGTSNSLTIDHLYSIAKGGDNSIENLWVLCRRCNSHKTSNSWPVCLPKMAIGNNLGSIIHNLKNLELKIIAKCIIHNDSYFALGRIDQEYFYHEYFAIHIRPDSLGNLEISKDQGCSILRIYDEEYLELLKR